MTQYLLLFQNEALEASLALWLTARRDIDPAAIARFHGLKEFEPAHILEVFEATGDWIESELSKVAQRGERGRTLVLTDLCNHRHFRLDDLDPMGMRGWSNVLGMLILAYPDVGWLFLSSMPLNPLEPASLFSCFSNTPGPVGTSLDDYALKLTTLFDGFGLRNMVRQVSGSACEVQPKLRTRDHLAIAVDEEQNYAGMHAYIAYRFNFRALSITTYEGLTAIRSRPEPIELLLEDLFLEFPDSSATRLSDLTERDDEFPPLAKANARLLLTTGYRRGVGEALRYKNAEYLERLCKDGKWNRLMHKPLGGIFDVWKTSGLVRRYPKLFVELPDEDNAADDSSGHGAPGRLLAIADRLIYRARSIPVDAALFELLKRAVLACDALDLLGGKTPTTALHALLLKHESEVLAECQFLGMQHHVEVDDRIQEIRKEVEIHSTWFGPTTRQRSLAARNAELSILSRLVEIFQDHNRFDEDQILQGPIRRLHRQLRFQKYPAVLRPLSVFPWYAETLVSSFPLFMIAMVGWILVLGLAFKWMGGVEHYDQAFIDSFSTFLSIQPPSDKPLWEWGSGAGWNGAFSLIALTIVLGFVHLGIFISYLYSLISRR